VDRVAVPGGVHVNVLEGRSGKALDDIRTNDDNSAASHQIVRIVNALVQRAEVLHGLVAGGRRTLALYLTLAFQIYGRPDDRLYHVLVEPELERDPSFFFPLPGSGHSVELATLPYLRLRQLAGTLALDEPHLDSILQALQARLSAPALPELVFRRDDRGHVRVKVNDREIGCRPGDAQLWMRLAHLRKLCPCTGQVPCERCSVEPEKVPPEWARWIDERDPKLTAASLRSACSRIRRKLKDAGISAGGIGAVAVSGFGRRCHHRYGVSLVGAAIVLPAGEG
ncbi:MAG: TIGR02584 family CRISPR-associated protein, partial [Candidatus Riflebacteria bacterium]|nr:TIGR02584 family CRISPR-associated protein [Candidatus Riflebacteria bacterium]